MSSEGLPSSISSHRKRNITEVSEDSGDEADVSSLSISFIDAMDTEETDTSRADSGKPVGIFAELGAMQMERTATKDRVLGQLYLCNGLRFFKTTTGLGEVLDRLRDIEIADRFANLRMPIKFQGSAMAAVQLQESQKSKAISLLSTDRNGTWHFKYNRWGTVENGLDDPLCFLHRYYSNRVQNAAKRVIAFFVDKHGSLVMSENCVAVVSVYWSKDCPPEEFSVGKERSSKAIISLLRQNVKLDSRGSGLSPMCAYKEACSSAESSDDIVVNPFHRPKNVKQAANAKAAEKKSLFGSSVANFLDGQKHVHSRSVDVDGDQFLTYVFAHPYQLNLFAGLCGAEFRQPMYGDTTFNMGGKYIMTTVMEHPMLQNRMTGGPALLQMPAFMTPSVTQKAYEQFAWFLRQSVDNRQLEWQLRLITDGEQAMYNAFLQVFENSVHALCAIHSRDGISRKIRTDYKDIDTQQKRLIMFDIYGFVDNENQNHSPGLIDSETVELFVEQLESCRVRWKHDKFFSWFVKYQKQKFEEKLILPARQKVGLQKNLAHTNHNEAYHSKVKRIVGEVADPRQVTMGIMKLADEQKNDMVNALFDQGPFKLRMPYAALRIQESRIYDQKYVKQQVDRLFLGDPGDIYLQRKGQTVTSRSDATTKNDSDTAGAVDLHPAYKSLYVKGKEIVNSTPENILDLPSSSNVFYRLIMKSEGKNTCYHVKISNENGQASCTCDTYKLGRFKLCEHIMAVAVKENVVDKVMEGNVKEPETFRDLMMGKPNGGKKPQSVSKRISQGHTKRDGLTVLPNIYQLEQRGKGLSSLVKSSDTEGKNPWEVCGEKFKVTKEDVKDKRIICAGCRGRLTDAAHRPNLDLLVCRKESDWVAGSNRKLVTKPKIRRYHMRTSCIRERHKEFDPTAPGTVTFDGSWLTDVSDAEKNLADMFVNGRID